MVRVAKVQIRCHIVYFLLAEHTLTSDILRKGKEDS